MAANVFEHAKAKRINLAPRATPRAPAQLDHQAKRSDSL
jgi:hypothetical protein